MSIQIEHLSHIYNYKTEVEVKALDDVTVNFDGRFFTAVIGKTGSGKSTLIQHINGLLKPNTGKINVDGFVISSNKKECSKNILNLRKNVGYLFQFSENQLFEDTVLKDVMFAPINYGYSKEEATSLAKGSLNSVGIGSSFYEKSPFELSGGEKRRVALAGVIATKPKYLILDEPTAGLDHRGIEAIMSLLVDIYNNGTNIILITHDMDIAYKYATDILLIDNKKVVFYKPVFEAFQEDLSKYDIESPNIVKLVKDLKAKGLKINFNNVRDIDDLLKEIKGYRK